MKSSHKLCLQSGAGSELWYFGLDHMPDSAALAWPVLRRPIPDHPDEFYFQIVTDLKRPPLAPVLNVDWLACSVDFISPARVRQRFSTASRLPCGVLMVQSGESLPLVSVAAHAGFWSFGRTILDRIAKHIGCATLPASNLVETLFQMITFQLPHLDESAVMQVIAKRMGNGDLMATFDTVIMEVEEAVECLHPDDHKEFKDVEEKAATNRSDRSTFRDEFRKQAGVVRARAKPKAKAKAKAKALPRKDFPTTLTQAEAKAYLPAGCSVWRAISHSAWAGHCPPHPRISSSWSLGEFEAMREVIRRLWRQHLDKEGLDNSACPFNNLL